MSIDAEDIKTLSVSEALGRAKACLEDMVMVVSGEVSQFKDSPSYKAIYFPLSDGSATMDCMMWRNRYLKCDVKLEQGLKVNLTGRFTVYPAKGRMQFEVFSIEEAGQGDLRQRVARLARKLEHEGLMDPARKPAIPVFCESVAVITSPHGKVKDDVARTLRRRNPLVRLMFYAVQVEGQTAAAQMIEALERAQSSGCMAILLVRGGGSYEDLMPFNDEALARAVAASSIPVITGIGHEPDTTICDMVSARRCSTPTAAAESVAPAMSELRSELESSTTRISHCFERYISDKKAALELLASRPCLTDPMRAFVEMPAYELDQTHARLLLSITSLLGSLKTRASELKTRLIFQASTFPQSEKSALGVRTAALDALSPLATLARGYSISRDDRGHIISSVTALSEGSALSVTVSDGSLDCRVCAVHPNNEGSVV